MIKYKERSINVDASKDLVTVWRNFALQNWNPPLALFVTIPYVVPAYRRLYERMWWDDGRTWSNGFYLSRTSWKPCQHYKCYIADPVDQTPLLRIPWSTTSITDLGSYVDRVGMADRLLAADSSTFRSSFGSFGSHSLGLPSITVENSDQSFVPAPSGLTVLTQRALASMLPTIKSDMSLINSIIELKDFKSFPETLRLLTHQWYYDLPAMIKNLSKTSVFHRVDNSLINVIHHRLNRNVLKKIRKTFNRLEGKTLAELFRAPADGYLQLKFNIQPLLKDLTSIYNAVSGLEKTLRGLLNHQGRRQTKHFTWKWLPAEFSGPNQTLNYSLNLGQFAGSTNPPGFTGCTNSYRRSLRMTREVIVSTPATFHAEIEYSYMLSSYQVEHAQLLTLLDSMGVNLNPAIIWNAIPWSFVVDWFLGVSRWLGDRKVLNMEPRVGISRYMWSWKYSRRIRTSFDSNTVDGMSPVLPKTYLPDLYEEAYRRDIRMPTRSDSFFGSGFSSDELTLGAALVFARRRHQNTRMRG